MTAEYLISVFQIILIDIVLSGDNAVVIAMAAHKLPAHQRKRAILWGGAIAILMRIVFTLIMAFLLMVPLVRLLGGFVLCWIACKLLMDEEDEHEIGGDDGNKGTWAAIRMIFVADLVMSLDNMLAVAGASHGDVIRLLIGLFVSIGIIMTCSALIAQLMNKYKWIVYVGAGILAFTAAEMMMGDREVAAYLVRDRHVSLSSHWDDWMLTHGKVKEFKDAQNLPADLKDVLKIEPVTEGKQKLTFIGQMTMAQRDEMLAAVKQNEVAEERTTWSFISAIFAGDEKADRAVIEEMYDHAYVREVPGWVPDWEVKALNFNLRQRAERWLQSKWPAQAWSDVEHHRYPWVAWGFYGLVVTLCMVIPHWLASRAKKATEQKSA